MKHSEKEIIDALKVIKSLCERNLCNDDCPFYDVSRCVIQNEVPNNWNIVDYRPTFKAFK